MDFLNRLSLKIVKSNNLDRRTFFSGHKFPCQNNTRSTQFVYDFANSRSCFFCVEIIFWHFQHKQIMKFDFRLHFVAKTHLFSCVNIVLGKRVKPRQHDLCNVFNPKQIRIDGTEIFQRVLIDRYYFFHCRIYNLIHRNYNVMRLEERQRLVHI